MKRRAFLQIAAAFVASALAASRKAIAAIDPQIEIKPTPEFGSGLWGMRNAMRAKDIDLYYKIENESVRKGIWLWQQKYPEDFKGVNDNMFVSDLGPHLIQI